MGGSEGRHSLESFQLGCLVKRALMSGGGAPTPKSGMTAMKVNEYGAIYRCLIKDGP